MLANGKWAELRKEQNHYQSTSLKEGSCLLSSSVSPLLWLPCDVMLLDLLQPCGPEQCLRDVGADLAPWATAGTELPKAPGNPVHHASIMENKKAGIMMEPLHWGVSW